MNNCEKKLLCQIMANINTDTGWFLKPEYKEILSKAKQNEFVLRPSETQIEWTDKGVKECWPEPELNTAQANFPIDPNAKVTTFSIAEIFGTE